MKKAETALGTAGLIFLAGLASADTITVMNFANNTPPLLLEDFEKRTGHTIDLITVSNTEEAIGRFMASGGAGYDIIFLSTFGGEPLVKMGLIAKYNKDNIPNLKNIAPEAASLPDLDYSVPYAWGVGGLCYRADLVDKAPESWWDVLKPSEHNANRITTVQTERHLLMPALKVLGYSLNDVDPAHLEEAKQILIEAKKTLLAYDDINMASRLVSGEAYIAQTWDGWCNYGTMENENIKFVVPKEGADFFADLMWIPEKSEKKEIAEQFINMMLEPEIHSWVTTELFYKVPNPAAIALVPKETVSKYPNIDMNLSDLVKHEMLVDLGENHPLVSRVATEVLAAQ